MVSSITYYDDFYASSSWARSVDTIACVRRSRFAPNPPANSLGWCAAHLRLSSGSSDGAPRIFGSRSFRMIGKLLLPAAMAEQRAAANKYTDNEAPAKQTATHMQGRPPRRLPKRLPRQPQPHRTWNPGLQGKLPDSTRRRRRRSQTKHHRLSKWHGGGQHGRPLKKPRQQLAQGGTR
jgi:hypothetical protein